MSEHVGYDHAWRSQDGVARIWLEPESNRIIVDTYTHVGDPASMSPEEAREAAVVLLALADKSKEQTA